MYTITHSTYIAAPPEVVWQVLTDFKTNGEQAPNLLYQKPEFDTEGALVGRVCANNQGESWREDVLIWEPPMRYRTAVDTSDYPYPFETMIATNAIEAERDGTRVTVTYDFEPDFRQPLKWAMAIFTQVYMRRITLSAMKNWAIDAKRLAANDVEAQASA